MAVAAASLEGTHESSISDRAQSAERARPAAGRARSLKLAPFAYGFRPFFFGALAYALIGLGAWLWIRATSQPALGDLPPSLWHGHEMLFGFIGAAIAGFLLTAVPSWTGARGFAGLPLIALTAVWLAGRVAFACASHLPAAVVAVAELAFLPALALLIAPPLLRARNRNTVLLLVLLALWIVDVTFIVALARTEPVLATGTLRVGIDIVLLLITVIGGRIVPAFTSSALRRSGIDAPVRNNQWLDAVVIGAMVFVVIIDAIAPLHAAAAVVAGVAAVGHAARLAGWRGLHARREPIVWVLHIAYAWLPLGLALKAVYLTAGADWAAQWLHALTAGAAATMIVAVITRASLGHTGRPLVVSRVVAAAYLLLTAAALVRVFGTSPLAPHRDWMIWLAGALWLFAFALILIVYAPILLRPRLDGRPG